MSKLDFISYLRETDARNDSNFPRYRVETEALKRLSDPNDRAFLAIGLKGSVNLEPFLAYRKWERQMSLSRSIMTAIA
jgi:hypothetical protein